MKGRSAITGVRQMRASVMMFGSVHRIAEGREEEGPAISSTS
jgi:hypothetical protein